jgi:hypothetical protein
VRPGARATKGMRVRRRLTRALRSPDRSGSLRPSGPRPRRARRPPQPPPRSRRRWPLRVNLQRLLQRLRASWRLRRHRRRRRHRLPRRPRRRRPRPRSRRPPGRPLPWLPNPRRAARPVLLSGPASLPRSAVPCSAGSSSPSGRAPGSSVSRSAGRSCVKRGFVAAERSPRRAAFENGYSRLP